MTVDSLFEQLKHPNPNLRERAIVELAESYDEQTIARLMANLLEDDVVYRRASVKALGYIGPDSVPSLVQRLQSSESPTERASCTKALTQVAVRHTDTPFPEEGLQALQQALEDPAPVVNISAVMALGQVGEPALDILLNALKTTENIAISVAILNALGSVDSEKVVTVLTEFSQNADVDTYLRESATSALSRLELVKQYSPD
ncbi:HEAT repeat domain-containing protein [Leptolyngbyaceae cyanobacterium CCMR0082]|uniref:HEAT repeat domain-containing protein n=2 Tax=Adonisia turfae TaxID=2950184 RepID=A0A6M0SBH0_9CYAN|nr:HEAT repeat domain-containing protein [Adonisia turfae]MDV3352639.1 HEAT repeat domain-containing protein [Leptothoe sp. LEGE 181152]NEZ59193.1 HEAT repeat domain-containing protein [Adonisia turfae CCMR0081]NEZ65804.1 HEAT repeat domain-containing protein [Adonisia turfae CCMR0082]